MIQDSIYPASSHSESALPICQLFRASPRSLHFPAAINSSNMEVDDRRALKGNCLTKTPQHYWPTLPHATNFPRLLGRKPVTTQHQLIDWPIHSRDPSASNLALGTHKQNPECWVGFRALDLQRILGSQVAPKRGGSS